MKSLTALAVGLTSMLASVVSSAQNDHGMNGGGMGDGGWMGGYGAFGGY